MEDLQEDFVRKDGDSDGDDLDTETVCVGDDSSSLGCLSAATKVTHHQRPFEEKLLEQGFSQEDAILMGLYHVPWSKAADDENATRKISKCDKVCDTGASQDIVSLKTKRENRSAESKKLRRKAYRQKKKKIRQDKYYEKLSEDNLKKRYRSIPIEERLPIGIVESDHDETEELSNSEKEKGLDNQHFDTNEPIEDIYYTEGNIPPIFNPILVPVEEPLPSPLPTQSQHSDAVHILQCKDEVLKARAERNDALLLAKHYRNMAENSKKEILCLEQKMQSQINTIEQRSASCVENIRNFWRDQIIEGGSRAGRILRASLIRK